MASIFQNFPRYGLSPRTMKSLAGALLLKLSTSVTTCWGNINLYFLSQFHHQGTPITSQTNASVLLISVVPMILALVYSNKLCKKYGYQFVIKVCAMLFFLFPLLNIFVFNLFTFTLCSIIVPGSMFALSSIPILNCMWTQFPQHKNKITAILVIMFGIGSIVWNLLFMHLINPMNQSAPSIHHEHQHQHEGIIGEGDQMSFFSENVTRNVRKTAIIGFAVTGIISIIGSWLIQRKVDPNQQESHSNKKQQHAQFQIKEEVQMQKQIEEHGYQYVDKQNEKQTQNQRNGEGLSQPKSNQKYLSQGRLTTNAKTIKVNENSSTNNIENDAISFEKAISDQRFILIMLISFLTGLYQIHLMMNFKIIFMPLINDDHFLSYCSMLCSVVAIIGAFFWGCLGDLKGVAFTILILSVLDIGSKLYSDFAVTKSMIVGMVVLIGLISKSMTTLAGPGFVEYFGIKVGTQLLPFKGVAILVGYLTVPFFQLISSPYLTPREYLICISFASVITLGSSIRLYFVNKKHQQGSAKKCIQEEVGVEGEKEGEIEIENGYRQENEQQNQQRHEDNKNGQQITQKQHINNKLILSNVTNIQKYDQNNQFELKERKQNSKNNKNHQKQKQEEYNNNNNNNYSNNNKNKSNGNYNQIEIVSDR